MGFIIFIPSTAFRSSMCSICSFVVFHLNCGIDAPLLCSNLHNAFANGSSGLLAANNKDCNILDHGTYGGVGTPPEHIWRAIQNKQVNANKQHFIISTCCHRCCVNPSMTCSKVLHLCGTTGLSQNCDRFRTKKTL